MFWIFVFITIAYCLMGIFCISTYRLICHIEEKSFYEKCGMAHNTWIEKIILVIVMCLYWPTWVQDLYK